MKLPLPFKFIVSYVILAIIGFCLLNTLGVRLLESYLLEKQSTLLYEEAASLAANDALRYYQTEDIQETSYSSLQTIARTQKVTIQIIDTKGTIILDTDSSSPKELEGFDPASMSSSYYTIDTFFGYYDTDQINVLAPITISMSTRGYVSIHQPTSVIRSDREYMLYLLLIFYSGFLLLFFLLLVLLLVAVFRPLKQITRGTEEFASGNLDYQIEVNSKDEMERLADTLNYMAGELKQTETFQRDFISNVSHDFRSPLTSIKGYVEAILDGTIPPEMQEKYLKIVLFETSRLTKLTQGMLQLNDFDAKEYMLNITDFDLHGIIKETAASFEGTCIARYISIELLLSSQHLYVSADKEKIRQVLYNLIDNAIKFSDDYSAITIETTEKNGRVFVSVKDRGAGIPKESLPKIWDRFYKIDASRGKDRKGTGLGLAIVKEILATHHQNINVISTEGVGSQFVFTLEKSKSIADEDDSLL